MAAWVALSSQAGPSQRLGGVAACLGVARRGSCAKLICCVSRALAVELSAAALFSADGRSKVPSVALGSSTALGGASGQGDSAAALHAILVALGACAGSCMPHLSVGRLQRNDCWRGQHAADTQRYSHRMWGVTSAWWAKRSGADAVHLRGAAPTSPPYPQPPRPAGRCVHATTTVTTILCARQSADSAWSWMCPPHVASDAESDAHAA